MSQICAFTVLVSMLSDRVANSTPIVDLDSRLNSLRVNRESTVGGCGHFNSLLVPYQPSMDVRLLRRKREGEKHEEGREHGQGHRAQSVEQRTIFRRRSRQ